MLRLFRDSMSVDPSGGFPTVDIPLARVGLGTGRGTIRDARSGRMHTFRVPRMVAVAGVLCVPLRSLMTADGLHNVELPDGLGDCWARAVGDVRSRDAAIGSDDSGSAA